MKPIQVSQLNRYINTVFRNEPLLTNIPVTGEVSGIKYHSSGHVYFSLKDKTSVIRCFLPADRVRYLKYTLEDGMQIVAEGYVSVYERGGYYSLNVRNVRIEGEGDLAVAFEALKQKLAAEGLFDEKYKKPLPAFPLKVGVVTSPTGAAIRDILRTIRNKNHLTDIVLCPCLVQGDGAAEDVSKAIRAMNELEFGPDVLIVGRGGGSIEDLWAFNEEPVARAIFGSEIPVISAVGHETDFTIADFAADVRAATPTAAAEMAVQDTSELKQMAERYRDEARVSLERIVSMLEGSMEMSAPKELMRYLTYRLENAESRADVLMKEASAGLKEAIHREELKIETLKSRVESMDPMKILSRGYGIVSFPDGKMIRSVKETGPGQEIRVRLADGELDCLVENSREITKG